MIDQYVPGYPTERHLDDKSKLVFKFNIDNGGTEGSSFYRTLGFMENIKIDEKVSTNYADYTPLGSNGSVFAYLGSKSRVINLAFNITLPHIMEGTLTPVINSTTPVRGADELRSLFFKGSGASTLDEKEINKYNTFLNHVEEQHRGLLSSKDKITLLKTGKVSSVIDSRKAALVKIMFWINLIRASCITHSKKPQLGPPLVRLHHGILYSDIPCMVNSYNINYDERHGFDTETLLPRVISVRLELKEVRLRGKAFAQGEEGDYMPGWDSIFVDNEFVTLDPNIPTWTNT
tara:strand:- start:2981 stop:3850 length:870 start_codon:yes stop_codon:yes gene_type:complete